MRRRYRPHYPQHLVQPAGLVIWAGFVFGLVFALPAFAHHPNRETQPVLPRIEVIPPLGTHWPSYRERYNRPTYIGGKIAYWIEPTSQEAMSWHRAVHRGYYANHAPRMETFYLYPKPWEVFQTGPRPAPFPTETEEVRTFDLIESADEPPSDLAPPAVIEAPSVELLPLPE